MAEEFSFLRYLAAKQTLDDRSLNHHVWQSLRQAVRSQAISDPLRAIEIGAGSGAMIERMLDDGLLTNTFYTAVDTWAEGINAIAGRLKRWAHNHGWGWKGIPQGITLLPPQSKHTVQVHTTQANALHFTAHPLHQGKFNLLIAHAFLDLLDLPTALPILLRTLRPDGFCYFSLNFDGITAFLPTVDRQLDEQIEALYHRSMDERLTDGKPSGDHRSGRHLLVLLRQLSIDILAAGSSDWVVHAVDDRYPDDEAYFLRHILHFVESTLRGHPELPTKDFENWLQIRHAQINNGQLIYIAHQLDVIGQRI
jgi:SAM-dependent methyltransferase